jgi:hypothetical protein
MVFTWETGAAAAGVTNPPLQIHGFKVGGGIWVRDHREK